MARTAWFRRAKLARIQPFFAQMGITRLANVTGLDTIGIPVVMACRPNSRSLAVTQGKGLDLEAAKVSAAMESIECHHAERILLPLKFASYRELVARHVVVAIEQLPAHRAAIFIRTLRSSGLKETTGYAATKSGCLTNWSTPLTQAWLQENHCRQERLEGMFEPIPRLTGGMIAPNSPWQ